MDSSANKVAVIANPKASRPIHREFGGQVLFRKMDIIFYARGGSLLTSSNFFFNGQVAPRVQHSICDDKHIFNGSNNDYQWYYIKRNVCKTQSSQRKDA